MDAHNQIVREKAKFGRELLILGHHYQDPSVLRHADVIGDSLELARKAASARDARRIVFCGVHFMAESAAILGSVDQVVYMPDVTAGCPMAEMAGLDDAERAWAEIAGTGEEWLPVVYVNSSASIKAFCGKNGGSTCTSSNARKVFDWVLRQHKRIFFLPDEHLGINTADDLGIPESAIAVYDPAMDGGGLDPSRIHETRVVVWRGYCHVHTAFTAAQIANARQRWPAAHIIVHPETPREVVRLADAHGSTSQIIDYVRNSPAGATIVIGTETHLVQRLAAEEQGRVTIVPLNHSVCPNMARTTPARLAHVLTDWPEANRIFVAQEVAAEARLALGRMLRL